MSDLSIVIENSNRRDSLLACLSSIAAAPPARPYDVWVVDNGSSDGSADAVRAHYPQVNIIANQEKHGLAAAKNQAIQACRGNFVLLLDGSTIIQPDSLNQLARFLDSHPRVGIVGACLVNQDGSYQPSWAAFPSLWSELLGHDVRRRRPYLTYDGSEAYAVDWVDGSALLIRRAVIQQVGGLDEGYARYAQETDWCYRVRQAGWDICYLPDAVIVSQRVLRGNGVSAGAYRGKLRFYTKHYGVKQARQLQFLLKLRLYGNLLFDRLAGRGDQPTEVQLLVQELRESMPR